MVWRKSRIPVVYQMSATDCGAACLTMALGYFGDGAVAAQATRQVLAFVLEQSLRLLHPYMPFVTEAIWSHLPGVSSAGEALMTSRWPAASGLADATAEEQFGRLQEMIRAVRNARSEYNVAPGRKVAALIAAGEYAALVLGNAELLASQAKIDGESLHIAAELPAPAKSVALAVGGVTIYLPLAGLVDMEAERKRLQKEMENVDGQIARIDGLLGNAGFLAKAPEQVVNREKAKLEELRGQRVQLQANLAELGVKIVAANRRMTANGWRGSATDGFFADGRSCGTGDLFGSSSHSLSSGGR